MKIRPTLIAAIALVIFTFSACDKDAEVKKNSFKYNDKEAEIGTALGFAYGQTEVSGVYWIAMEFFEKTFTVFYQNGYPDSLAGKGDALLITFLSNKEAEITPGEYTLKPSADPSKPFTIDGDDETGLIIGFDAATENDPPYVEINGGKVTVAKNGDEYEFTFNLSTNVNSTVTGYYKGKPVIFIDKKKKSTGANSWFPL
jgi:hypothetical protein